jgi:hypothetical protein
LDAYALIDTLYYLFPLEAVRQCSSVTPIIILLYVTVVALVLYLSML